MKPISIEETKTSKEKIYGVLVLGMIQLQSKEEIKLKQDSPLLRDFYRLETLKKVLGNPFLFTVSNRPEFDDVKFSSFHVEACFTRRGAQTLTQYLKTFFPHFQFNLVLCDYFRFPTAYMHQAYSNLCDKKIPFSILFIETIYYMKTVKFSSPV